MLEGIVRESTTKQATRELKKDGYLIANIYGAGVENINAAFKKNDFIRYVKNKENLAFDVKVGDKTHKVIIQEYQKNPVTSDLTHVDLRTLSGDKVAKFIVPITTTGTPIGLKNKGILVINKKRVALRCKADQVPNGFELDVTDLDTGFSILVRDVETPEGVEFIDNDSVALVSIVKAK